MTNEALAAAIKAGDISLICDLWEQVSAFVAMMAKKRLISADTTVVDVDDLIQSGFFALLDAVRTFDEAAGCAFTTWLSVHLQKHFSMAMNTRSEKQRNDPLHDADSLQRLIRDDDESTTLGDLQPDKNAQAAFEAVEHGMWNEQLHAALAVLLDDLPQDQRQAVSGKYYDGLTVETLARRMATTQAQVRSAESKGMRELRRSSWRLRPFVADDLNYFRHVSAAEFGRTQTSAVEVLAILRENAQERSGV